MKPPICDMCSRRFDPDKEGGLVYFRQTKKGKEFESRVREEGVTGHPPDADWFCGTHSKEAAKLVHLPLNRAREILEKKLKDSK